MLTQARPSRTDRRPAGVAAVASTARLAHPWLIALTVGLGALPTVLTMALGGDGLFVPLVLAGLVSGAAVGLAVDDPAAELLASMPVGAPARFAIRITAAAVVAAGGFAALIASVALWPGLPDHVADRVPEAAAAAGAALAFGLVAARRGERAAGAAAVTGGVLVPAFVASLSFRIEEIPSFISGPHHGRWWWVALVALSVAIHSGRDPARP